MRILLFFCLFFCSVQLSAQEVKNIDDIVLAKNPLDKKWGYVNKEHKRNIWSTATSAVTDVLGLKKKADHIDWTIPPQYDRASKKFSGNLSAVLLNGKIGYIDKKNRFIIEPQYEEIDKLFGFKYGLSVVKKNGKYGYIDKGGNMVIPPTFEWADNFNDNMLASVREGGKYGAIDIMGNLVVPYKYKLEEAMTTVPISNKEYRQAAKDAKSKKEQGAFDEYFQRLDSVSHTVNRLISDSTYVPPLPDYDLYIKVVGDSIGLVREEGDSTWLLNPCYTSIDDWGNGLMLLGKKNDMWGMADYYGRIVVPCDYNYIEYESDAEVFIVREDSLFGFYSRQGILQVPTCFDAIDSFIERKANVWIEGEMGWVDTEGRLQEGFLDRIYNGGVRMEQAGKLRSARRIYGRILTLEPDYALVYNNLGIMDINIEEYKEGMKKLKLAHDLDPDNEIIAENLKQARKDRSERRWNRVMKGFEVAATVVDVAATTYNTVEAVKGNGNNIDINGSAGFSGNDSNDYGAGSYGGGSELIQEKQKLQQLYAEKERLLRQRGTMHQQISRQGVQNTKRAGTSLKMNHGQVRPGQGNYGRGVAERNSRQMSDNKVELKNIDSKIARCQARIRELERGEEPGSVRSSSTGSSNKGTNREETMTGADQYNFNTDSNTYMNCYNELLSMKNRNGLYSNATLSEISRARQDKQQIMKRIRQRWEGKGKKIGNSDTWAMENWR